jgi:hypothetical protein
VNWLRAVMRRLDPWAAIVLGGLLAMGVVILLATPGPWQKVVHTQPPVRLEAPAPVDVAVFVMGGRGGSCTGILWLHVDAASNGLAAVVVAPRISGFSPADGYAPVAAIADSAGPAAAATALGGALGVGMDAWVALDRSASDLAIQAMFPANDLRPARARYRQARTAWRGLGGDAKAWATQYESLSVALPQVSFGQLGVVAFSNYVLGFGFVRSDLTLQGATSLAEALKEVDPGQVVVRAAPVIAERSLGGEVWHADASRVEPLRQSLELGVRPPQSEKLVTVRTRAPRVLVIAPLARPAAQRYAAEVRRRLAQSAGAAVDVTLVWGTDGRLAFRAAHELDRRPALAALVAPASPGEAATAAVTRVCEMLRNRGQEAVVSGPLPAPTGDTGATPAAAASAARDALVAAVAAGRLPVSWLPAPAPAGATTGTGRRALAAAARDNVQTLVRACWPGALAPGLSSTRLGFAFVDARHTAVGVSSPSDAAAASLLARLRLWGFSGSRLTAAAGAPVGQTTIAYRPGSRHAALALAGDLKLPQRSVVRSGDGPLQVVITTGP